MGRPSHRDSQSAQVLRLHDDHLASISILMSLSLYKSASCLLCYAGCSGTWLAICCCVTGDGEGHVGEYPTNKPVLKDLGALAKHPS